MPAKQKTVRTRQSLKASYKRFMTATDATKKDAAGKDLSRSIFGENAIAKESASVNPKRRATVRSRVQ